MRYSGTQRMCGVMVEAEDAARTDRLAESIAAEVRRAIG